MADALAELHPDVVRVTWKFRRWQHQVDYRPFKGNQLIYREGVVVPQGINNYGMVLQPEGAPHAWNLADVAKRNSDRAKALHGDGN